MTIVKLKSEFVEKLKAEGLRFMRVGKSEADEENVLLVRLHVGGWAHVVENTKMSRVSPLHFKYYLPTGTPITGKGAPVLRTCAELDSKAGTDQTDAEVLAVEVHEGPPDPHQPGTVGYRIPHFATSLEAIAIYYETIFHR